MARRSNNVQNAGSPARSGKPITRAGRPTTPENQRVSKQSPSPGPVRMPGQSGSSPTKAARHGSGITTSGS